MLTFTTAVLMFLEIGGQVDGFMQLAFLNQDSTFCFFWIALPHYAKRILIWADQFTLIHCDEVPFFQ